MAIGAALATYRGRVESGRHRQLRRKTESLTEAQASIEALAGENWLTVLDRRGRHVLEAVIFRWMLSREPGVSEPTAARKP
jgi:hypothetical protein